MSKNHFISIPMSIYGEKAKDFIELALHAIQKATYKAGTFDSKFNEDQQLADGRMIIKKNTFEIRQFDANGRKVAEPLTKYSDFDCGFDSKLFDPYRMRLLFTGYGTIDDYVSRSSKYGEILLHQECNDNQFSMWRSSEKVAEEAKKSIVGQLKMLILVLSSLFDKKASKFEAVLYSEDILTDINRNSASLRTSSKTIKFTKADMLAFIDIVPFMTKKKSVYAEKKYIQEHGEDAWAAFFGIPDEDPFRVNSYELIDKAYYEDYENLLEKTLKEGDANVVA